MFAKFFIDRPVFAWVIAIVILLAGSLAVRLLPISQYPEVAPPALAITASYPGASAKVMEDTVVALIEQEMNGIENLLYMDSASEQGIGTINITFRTGTNLDIASVEAQNRIKRVEARLPDDVRRTGVLVQKRSNNILMLAAVRSPDQTLDALYLSNYVATNIIEEIRRIPGVGDAQQFDAVYAMRVWLDPGKLEKYALMPSDIGSAINAQNAQVSAGQLGALPAVGEQQLNATITARSKLQTKEEFEQIVLKSTTDGAAVRLKDVARIELGAENLTITSRLNGQPGASMSASRKSTSTPRPAARRRAFSMATGAISTAVTRKPCSASHTEFRPSPSAIDRAVAPFCSRFARRARKRLGSVPKR